ncbi:CLUMA_CG008428, isoform A [Clunio marinus]|uniref:CLUMA_CG008428, isoform A n=1 Tax=Clunio marinus TaxID=568069 RepID=A0A1J1I932_9DIPT|nr:CLUMA_CG008428, isoform A [Clunio marinus]
MWNKFLFIFVLQLIFGTAEAFNHLEPSEHSLPITQPLIKLVSDVMEIHQRYRGLNIFYFDPKSSKDDVEIYLRNILCNFHGKFVVQLEDYSKPILPKEYDKLGRKFNIVFVQSIVTINAFAKTLRHWNYDSSSFFLIVFLKPFGYETFGGMSTLSKHFWGVNIVNVEYMINYDKLGVVETSTIFPFMKLARSADCKSEFGLTGRYDISVDKWIVKNYFQHKNFHMKGCPLNVATFSYEPFMIIKKDGNDELTLDGIEGTLLNVLSEKMNFTPKITLVEEKRGFLYDNGSASGAMEIVMSNKVDLTLGFFVYHPKREKFMTSSKIYYTSKAIWAVPPGDSFTPFEKLTKPFQSAVWICFLIIFILALLIIEIINFCPKRIQDFMFGKNIKTPKLNVVKIILGGGLSKLPTRNFARTILIMFIFYCFIMSNSYTGGLFYFLQGDLRNHHMSSTQELLKNDFKFYAMSHVKTLLNDTPTILGRTTFIDDEEVYDRMINNLTDSKFKGAVMIPEENLAYRNIRASPNKYFNRANDDILLYNIVIYMNKFSMYQASIDRVLQNLISGGFINMWVKKFTDVEYLKNRHESRELALNFDQMQGVFQLLIIGLFISFIVLMLEIFIAKLKRRRNNVN